MTTLPKPKGKKGGKQPGAGRPAGVPNKTTRDVREAMAVFAEANVEKMGEWLNGVAEGAKKPWIVDAPIIGADGKPLCNEKGRELTKPQPVLDANGQQVYVFMRDPDPGKALGLYLQAIEYHVPKLARTEVSGIDGKAIPLSVSAEDAKL